MRVLKDSISFILQEALKFRWIVLGGLIFLYGLLFVKNQMSAEALHHNVSINYWDVVISIISDMYLILYLIFPVLLFFMIRIIILEFEYTTLIRIGSYKQWIYRIQWRFLVQLAFTVLIWVLISFFLTIGLPIHSDWSDFSRINIESQLNFVPWTLQLHFDKPIISFFLQILAFSVVMVLIQTIMSIIYVVFKNKLMIVSIGIFLFLWAILSFKVLPPSFNWLGLVNYLVLYHGVTSFNSWYISFIVIGILCLLCCFLIDKIDLNLIRWKRFFISKSGYVLYIALYFLGIWRVVDQLQKEDATIWDVWMLAFYGVTNEGLDFTVYMFYIIVFFGFVYFVQLFLQQEMSEIGYYKIIRFQSLYRWFWSWFHKVIIAIILFLMLLLLISIGVSWLFGFSIAFEIQMDLSTSLVVLLYQFFVNGFLQVVIYVLLVFIVSWLSKEFIHSLILIGVLIVLLIPGLNVLNVLPVGLNGLGHIVSGGQGIIISLILLGYILIEFLLVYFMLNKRDLYI